MTPSAATRVCGCATPRSGSGRSNEIAGCCTCERRSTSWRHRPTLPTNSSATSRWPPRRCAIGADVGSRRRSTFFPAGQRARTTGPTRRWTFRTSPAAAHPVRVAAAGTRSPARSSSRTHGSGRSEGQSTMPPVIPVGPLRFVLPGRTPVRDRRSTRPPRAPRRPTRGPTRPTRGPTRPTRAPVSGPVHWCRRAKRRAEGGIDDGGGERTGVR